MGSENQHNDFSMNSTYLDTFRRRKNRNLSAEIEQEDMDFSPQSGDSTSSACMEQFRRRKNRQFEAEFASESVSAFPEMSENEPRKRQRPQVKESVSAPVRQTSALALPETPERRPAAVDGRDEKTERASRSDFQPDSSRVKKPAQPVALPDRHAVKPTPSDEISDKPDAVLRFNRNERTASSDMELNVPQSTRPSASAASKGEAVAARQGEKETKKGSGRWIWLLVLLLAVSATGYWAVHSILGGNTPVADDISDDTLRTTHATDFPDRTEPTTTEATTASSSTVQTTTGTTAKTSADVTSETTASSATKKEQDQSVYHSLRPGDSGESVKKLQTRLYKLGYLGEESCTGYYGDYTKKSIKRFQKNAGLSQTGIADDETLQRLYAKDAPKNQG